MFESIRSFVVQNPHYGYLIVAGIMSFYLLGLILNWRWTLEPGGGLINTATYIEWFGEKTVRIVFGLIVTVGIIACLVAFYLTVKHDVYQLG